MKPYATKLRVTDTIPLDIGSIVVHTEPMKQQDPYIIWARQHRRLSAGAVRRRFQVSVEEAGRIIVYLLRERVLHPIPEGDSYRVRYPQPAPRGAWLHPEGQSYRYDER